MNIKGKVIHGRAYDISSSKTSQYRYVKTFHVDGVPVRLTSWQLLMISAGDEVSVGSFTSTGIINAQVFRNRSKNYWTGKNHVWMFVLAAAAALLSLSWTSDAINLTIEEGSRAHGSSGVLMIVGALLVAAGASWVGLMTKRMIAVMEQTSPDAASSDKPAPRSASQTTTKTHSANDRRRRGRDKADDIDRMF